MAKTTQTTPEEVRASVSSIYSNLLERRKLEKEAKEEAKREAKEKERQEKEEKKLNEDGTKLSKKERRQKEIDNWKEVVIGLTGDDLEYSDEKKKKKKYRQWIDDDSDINTPLTTKPKKVKKKNYNKEFENELNTLKTLVADQNRFTNELQKRFQIMVGPNNRDASPLNKTEVELASTIINSRANSLGLLREIGNIKKTIADLYMKQKKLDADLGNSSNMDTGDIALMGSNIAASLYGDNGINSSNFQSNNSNPLYGGISNTDNTINNIQNPQNGSMNNSSNPVPFNPNQNPGLKVEVFDPSSWDGGNIDSDDTSSIIYETIPHDIVVELHKDENKARFKAVRKDTGEELEGCPVPTSDPSRLTFNEKEMTVKGEFDEVYKLEII